MLPDVRIGEVAVPKPLAITWPGRFPMPSLARPRTRAARILRASVVALVGIAGLLWLADRIWPLPMPADDLARVVLAEDGTPLWRFADSYIRKQLCM